LIKFFSLLALLSLLIINNLKAQQHYSEGIYLLNSNETSFKNAITLLSDFDGILRVTHQAAKNPESNATIQFVYEHENNRFSAMQMLLSQGFLPYNANTHIPADFPRMMNNGTKEDKILFEAQKALWIQNHPERYHELNQQNGIHIISQSDFDQMPIEKQNHILNNPDLYQIE
jgi:hypothetical protein